MSLLSPQLKNTLLNQCCLANVLFGCDVKTGCKVYPLTATSKTVKKAKSRERIAISKAVNYLKGYSLDGLYDSL